MCPIDNCLVFPSDDPGTAPGSELTIGEGHVLRRNTTPTAPNTVCGVAADYSSWSSCGRFSLPILRLSALFNPLYPIVGFRGVEPPYPPLFS